MACKRNYTSDQMAKAIEAVEEGMPTATAAKKFGVPRVTLYYKTSGKSPKVCRFGPATVLSDDEEKILVQWLLSTACLQYPVTKELLLDSVEQILKQMKRANPFTDGRPGRKWYTSFLKRHPELSERVAQNLTTARANVTEEQVRNWFSEVHKYLRDKSILDITNDPNRVFNADESAFFLQPTGEKVITKKGSKVVYSIGNDEKENLTVLMTANAAGKLAPPMVVFSYARIPSLIANSIPTTWGIGRSESGWMCGPTFYEYMTNVFYPWLIQEEIQRPIIFFIDGHVSHMTLNLSQFCSENGIELIALFPNSTHLLQPMDVAVFGPLKKKWKVSVKKWRLANSGNKLKKENFGPVMSEAIQCITEQSIQNGFKSCGLCPFSVANVNFNKIAPKDCEVSVPVVSSVACRSEFNLKDWLSFLESNIPEDKMAEFRNSYDKHDWTGRIEDTSLFLLWKTMTQQLDSDNQTNRS